MCGSGEGVLEGLSICGRKLVDHSHTYSAIRILKISSSIPSMIKKHAKFEDALRAGADDSSLSASALHSSSLLGPVDPSFRVLAGRLKFTVRRHKFSKDSLSTLKPGDA